MDSIIQKASLPVSILLSILFVFAAASAQRQSVKTTALPVAVNPVPESFVEESPVGKPVAEPVVARQIVEPETVPVVEVSLPPLEKFSSLLPSFEVAEIGKPIAQQLISPPETWDPIVESTVESKTAALNVPSPTLGQLPPSNAAASVAGLPQQPLIPVFFYQPPLMVVPLYPVYSVYPVCTVYPAQPVPRPFVTAILPSSHGAPTFVFSNGVRMKPTFHVPGQPVRNRIRGFAP